MKIETTSNGTIQRVHVPMFLESDPAWYRDACLACGLEIGDTYPIDCKRLLTMGSGNAKILKSNKTSKRYLSAILHLAPHVMSGKNVCPKAKACRASCVAYNGHGSMSADAFQDVDTLREFLTNLGSVALGHNVHACRIAKTRLFNLDRQLFFSVLGQALDSFARSADRQGLIPLVRLNGTSDIAWEALRNFNGANVFEYFATTQYYDYTKVFRRALASTRAHWPDNYDLTFSRDESNHRDCKRVLTAGGRIAIVVTNDAMRRSAGGHLAKLGDRLANRLVRQRIDGFKRYPHVNGDKHDIRHLDPSPGVVVLKAKGTRAARDRSGFALDCT